MLRGWTHAGAMPLFEDVYDEAEFSKNVEFRMRVELPAKLNIGELRKRIARAAGVPEDEAMKSVRIFTVDYYPRRRSHVLREIKDDKRNIYRGYIGLYKANSGKTLICNSGGRSSGGKNAKTPRAACAVSKLGRGERKNEKLTLFVHVKDIADSGFRLKSVEEIEKEVAFE